MHLFSRLVTYIKETRQELKKVNWPTRQQTIQSTILVIAISVGVAFFLGAFDFIYRTLINTLIL